MEGMPVEVTAWFVALLNAILSRNGALDGVLCAIIWYLQRELGRERTAHVSTSDKLLATAKECITALAASAQASEGMRATLDRIMDRGARHGR